MGYVMEVTNEIINLDNSVNMILCGLNYEISFEMKVKEEVNVKIHKLFRGKQSEIKVFIELRTKFATL
jgi:hypothetical protein